MPRRRGDLLFTRAKVAVFVDGCFWHSCPIHGAKPENNAAWWEATLTRNVERDRETDAALIAAGWKAFRFWEHMDVTEAADAVEQAVRAGIGGERAR